MSKRQTDILSERLKDRLTKIKNDAELALVAVEEIGGLEITCCKCHGEGTYQVPYYVDDTTVEWEERDCELCHGTGKISLAFYEDLQRCVRKRE